MCTLLNAMMREDRICTTKDDDFVCCNTKEDDIKRLLRDQVGACSVYFLLPRGY